MLPSDIPGSLIAMRLRAARTESNFTLPAAANRADVSEQRLAQWEASLEAPPADSICRLAQAYRVSADYLLGLADHPSGLHPGTAIVDLDVVEAVRAAHTLAELQERLPAGSPPQPEAAALVWVCSRPAVMSSAAAKALLREVEARVRELTAGR